MSVGDFYNSVFPPVGLRALAVFKNGLKNAPTHTYYQDNDDLIEAAETWSKLGKNVYHGCATFNDGSSRTQVNVAAVKALWIDLDVGPKKDYKTLRESVVAAVGFAVKVGLSKPHLVRSGGGLHVYFAFSTAISRENWDKLAEVFRACLEHAGVHHDTSRTTDAASILRVPGTQNYKEAAPRAVILTQLGDEESAQSIYKKLKAYADANGVVLLGGKAPKQKGPISQANADLIGNRTYPPSYRDRIIQHCGVLGHADETGGDNNFETWRATIGIAKHLQEPDATAIHWTRNRIATKHDKDDWQLEADTWTTGPTLCEHFAKHSDKCKTCPHFGKIKSPIVLGYDEVPAVEPVVTHLPTTTEPQKPVVNWDFGADWIVQNVQKQTKIGYTNGQLTISVRQDEPDENGRVVWKHVPFCNRYWQVMSRVQTVDNKWQLEIGYSTYPGQPHRTFTIDSAAVTSPDLLRKEFSTYELHLYGGQRAMHAAQQKIMTEQQMLFGYELEMPTYNSMGWTSIDNKPRGALTGEFIIGDMRIAPGEPPSKIKLEKTLDVTFGSKFARAGTAANWKELINHIYNRPGAEAYQFIICAMFAAPLVRFSCGAAWHGIPIALTGNSGAAKSSTAYAALSLYGKGNETQFNGAGGKGGQGDTLNAMAVKMGMMGNIPFLIDEATGMDPEQLSSLLYSVPNGQLKDRSTPVGGLVFNPYRWDTISLMTGNDNFHEVLRNLKSADIADATQLRCFQIDLKSQDIKTIFHDVHKTTVENDLLNSNYGEAGIEWLQFLVNNREKVTAALLDARTKYAIEKMEETSALRFFTDLVLHVEVAARIAYKRGFIRFNVPAMMQWAHAHARTLWDSIGEKDHHSTASDFIASLHGRTIVTKKLQLGPGRRPKVSEMPLEVLHMNQPPVARRAIEDRLFFVAASALNEWARARTIAPSALLKNLVALGYIKVKAGEKVEPIKINLGGGTTVVRPQTFCWELDYDKVSQYVDGDDAVDLSNVASLPVTEVVTAPAANDPDVAVSP